MPSDYPFLEKAIEEIKQQIVKDVAKIINETEEKIEPDRTFVLR